MKEPLPTLDDAKELIRERAWRGASTDLDEAFEVVWRALGERDQLRRWLLAVTLGRATKDMHAEMRDYLRRIGW